MEVLRTALLSPIDTVHVAALEMTLALSADTAFCSSVENSGIVTALVPFLADSDRNKQLCALLALVHFAAVSKKNRAAILQDSDGSESEEEDTEEDESSPHIAVHSIVELLKAEESAIRAGAVELVAHLAHEEILKPILCTKGVVPPLLACLESPDPTCTIAASTISSLAISEAHRETIGYTLGGVEALLVAFTKHEAVPQTVPLLCNVVMALQYLLFDDANKEAFLSAQGVETLLEKLARDREGHILPYTADLLHTISFYRPAVKALQQANGVEMIISLLHHKRDEEVLAHLLRAVHNIALTDEGRVKLQECGSEVLTRLLQKHTLSTPVGRHCASLMRVLGYSL